MLALFISRTLSPTLACEIAGRIERASQSVLSQFAMLYRSRILQISAQQNGREGGAEEANKPRKEFEDQRSAD